jgi:hypothetical protein
MTRTIGSKHLTTIEAHKRFEDTFKGQASWGTSKSRHCRQCAYWGADLDQRPDPVKGRARCVKASVLSGFHLILVPARARACRYFLKGTVVRDDVLKVFEKITLDEIPKRDRP